MRNKNFPKKILGKKIGMGKKLERVIFKKNCKIKANKGLRVGVLDVRRGGRQERNEVDSISSGFAVEDW